MSELAEDIARRVAQNEVRLVPAEGQTGYYLGVTGQSPFRYAFLQPPDDEIPRFAGSPDGVLGAPIDSLVRDTDDHTVWINTDGDTAWTEVGAGATTTFPITYDDGTVTYTIDIESGDLVLKTVRDSGSVLATKLEVYGGGAFAEGGFGLADPGGGGFYFDQHTVVNNGGVYFNLWDQAGFYVNDGIGGPVSGGGAGIYFNTTDTGGFFVNGGGGDIGLFGEGGNIELDPDTGGLYLFNLPTSDPGNSGQVWNSSGVLKVSP